VLRPPLGVFWSTPSSSSCVMSRSAVSGEHLAICPHLLLIQRAAIGAGQKQVAYGAGDAVVSIVERVQRHKPEMRHGQGFDIAWAAPPGLVG
jgi:hypothetical protein